MNRARVESLGFSLDRRAETGESEHGAWLATAPDGAPVVLKWLPGEAAAARYAALLPALSALRARCVPVPEYPHVVADADGTLVAQRVLPGRSWDNPPPRMIEQVVACVAAQAGIPCSLEPPGGRPWGEAILATLAGDVQGWAPHSPLRQGGRRSAALLDRILAVGAEAEAGWFPRDGLVHLDLHTDNVLGSDDGTLTGIIDWDGACAGDPRFDLVRFVFDLDGHDQLAWEVVEAAAVEPRVVRAYVAVHALRCTSWQLRFHPEDVPRQLARAERVLDRFRA